MHFLDRIFGLASKGPLFFSDGWGDRELCMSVEPAALARCAPARIDVQLGAARPAFGGTLAEGTFESPERRLPDCARTARIQLLLPREPPRGVAVHLAASGDQGFAFRLRFAAPLLAHGLGAVVLEQPYYGGRRPAKQPRHAVRCVSDLHLMGAATFQEARALLAWLRDVIGAPRVGVTGYSMGGQMAAMAGASMPWPVAVIPLAPTCSPDTVLSAGVLRDVADWAALGGRGVSREEARRELCDHLARFSVQSIPPPVLPEAAIVVGTSDDGVIPPAEMRRIAAHWGCELRWIAAGHISAVLRHQGTMRQAILDAFLRLEAAEQARGASGSRRRALARDGAPRGARAARVARPVTSGVQRPPRPSRA